MTEYEYEYISATQKWPNTNTNIIRLPNNDRIQISFGSDDWIQLQMQTASNPYDSPDVTLVYEDDMQIWHTK